MTNLLITGISTLLYLFGYGILLWGALRLLQRKGLPKTSITSLGIGIAFISLGLARTLISTDGGAALIIGFIFGIMSLVTRHWEKSGAEWVENEGA